MRYILFFVVIFWLTPDSSAQVKIKNNGYVGIGTLDPLVRLHVMGDGIFQNNFYQTLRILPGNPGVEIGASTSRIDFWYAGEGYNRLFAKSFTKMSDSCLKRDIIGLENCTSTLLRLRPVHYLLLNDPSTSDSGQHDFGFIAQEVEQFLPEIVSESGKGMKGIDYNSLVPILVGAIQEQQKQIIELQNIVNQQSIKIQNIENRNETAIESNAGLIFKP